MRVPRFLKAIIPFFVVIALMRFINGAEPLKLAMLLDRIQTFGFDPVLVNQIIDSFDTLVISFSEFTWSSDLGVLENIGALLSTFFNMIVAMWDFSVDVLLGTVKILANVIGDLFSIVFFTLGFNV